MIEQIAKEEAKAKREALEAAMALQLRAAGLVFTTQVQFHPVRKWRMDFVVAPQSRRPVAIEVQGGVYTNGSHTRGQGYEKDCEKSFYGQMLGWRVLAVTGTHVRNGQALEWVLQLLGVCNA